MTKFDSVIKADYFRNQAVWYLKQWIGTPYLWGGDDFFGYDCSGLVIEVLKSVGILPFNYDATADGLYHRFRGKEVKLGYAGCLVFWLAPSPSGERAIHVEMMIDEYHVVGASGGNSRTKTLEDAIRQNAFVKMRPVEYRGGNYKIIDPFKEVENGD